MLINETKIRVRYGETDQMGYVYYGNYPLYYEVGRVETLRELGIVYREMEINYGIMMPVMSMDVKYLRPARYDDLITIKTIVEEIPDKEIHFKFELYNEKGKLLNTGKVSLCFIQKDTNRRVAFPEDLRSKIKLYFERKNQ